MSVPVLIVTSTTSGFCFLPRAARSVAGGSCGLLRCWASAAPAMHITITTVFIASSSAWDPAADRLQAGHVLARNARPTCSRSVRLLPDPFDEQVVDARIRAAVAGDPGSRISADLHGQLPVFDFDR